MNFLVQSNLKFLKCCAKKCPQKYTKRHIKGGKACKYMLIWSDAWLFINGCTHLKMFKQTQLNFASRTTVTFKSSAKDINLFQLPFILPHLYMPACPQEVAPCSGPYHLVTGKIQYWIWLWQRGCDAGSFIRKESSGTCCSAKLGGNYPNIQ